MALQKVEYTNFSIIVVDSAPSSNAAEILASRYKVDYCASTERGLSCARNIGTLASRSEFVAYLDDDMVPHAGWLRSIIEGFADQDVKAVTGPVLPLEAEKSNDLELGVMLERVPWGPVRFDIDRSSRQWFERANFGGIGDGNFALRRDTFDKLPNFDERLGRGAIISSGEEHYAYFKLLNVGSKIAYIPGAIVFHPKTPVTKECRQKLVAEAVAYATFLAVHHPSQSWRVAKYIVVGAIGSGRWWRNPPDRATGPLSFREKSLAVFQGLSTFWLSWRNAHEVSNVSETINELSVRKSSGAFPATESESIINDAQLPDDKQIGEQAKPNTSSSLRSVSLKQSHLQ